jgi:hypothetical protein
MRKTFFNERTKAEIKAKNPVQKKLSELEPSSEYLILPSQKLVPINYESSRKFMKHGIEVKPRRYSTIEEAVVIGKTPVQLRERAFNEIQDYHFCGYSFMPISRDKRKRKVALIECLEGARLFAYSRQVPGTNIIIKPYDDSKKVRTEGAEIVCNVPSRTEGESRIQFKLMSVPIIDCPEKYLVSQNLGSDHSCGSKRFNIRYKYAEDKESSGIVNICAHEIAGYLEIIDFYLNQEKNVIPLQMSQFAIPTQFTVENYLNMCNNVLIEDKLIKSKDHLRKPNSAEKEIMLWGLVKRYGHDKTFYARNDRDGLVQKYDWSIPGGK